MCSKLPTVPSDTCYRGKGNVLHEAFVFISVLLCWFKVPPGRHLPQQNSRSPTTIICKPRHPSRVEYAIGTQVQ
ncbi:hypothetical protein CEXT_388181 [Caerostris extrusa]|uniref:Uncharacterized protein n=1 Tax=Caerostris extrusa TaxID=172846 RepID=A0AAV4VLZ7_CAEEX|nr:hypothetical protein CEXT_388181 [Caerostris extrusa]